MIETLKNINMPNLSWEDIEMILFFGFIILCLLIVIDIISIIRSILAIKRESKKIKPIKKKGDIHYDY